MADIQKLLSQVEAQKKRCEQEKSKLDKLETKLALEQSKEISQLVRKYNITDIAVLEQALTDWQNTQEKENKDE